VDKKRVMSNATFSDYPGIEPRPHQRRLGPGRTMLYPATTLLIAVLFILLLGPPLALHSWAETNCPVPDGLALRDIALPAARQAVMADQRLVVLTFGGVHPAGSDSDALGATYPARLEAELAAALPRVQVSVTNEMPPGKTSADVPSRLPDLIAKTGARLVIWGPGSRDAAARVDPGLFFNAVSAGINAVRHAGADMILLDTTFFPSPARMAMIEAYRQKLLIAATANNIPLLRRHDLMREWSEDGTLNLGAHDQAEQERVARRLFSCVARSLAVPIATALR
jgi:hypothetical protein